MRVLLIVGNYYPKPSSVANCVNQLVNALIEEGHTVALITDSTDSIHPYTRVLDKITITFIPSRFGYYSQEINKRFEIFGSHRVVKYLRKITKIPIYLRYYLFAKEAGLVGWYTRKNAQSCWKIFQDQQFDVIISFSHPFSGHFFANTLFDGWGGKIPWMLFEFDPYAYNDVSSWSQYLFRRHKKQEEGLFNKASSIIVTPELLEFYRNSAYKVFLGKIHQLPYILLQPNGFENPVKNHGNSFRMVYTGSFYNDIRNPLYALKVIARATNGHTLFLTNYNERVFMQTISKFPGKFEVREMADQDAALSLMNEADVLISVGNTIEIQVPGKIFEYMGLGKPIIHFCKTPKDPALKYLSRYQMTLIINEFEIDVDGHAKQIDEFLHLMKGKRMDYEEVKKRLPELDLESVTKKFLSIVESMK